MCSQGRRAAASLGEENGAVRPRGSCCSFCPRAAEGRGCASWQRRCTAKASTVRRPPKRGDFSFFPGTLSCGRGVAEGVCASVGTPGVEGLGCGLWRQDLPARRRASSIVGGAAAWRWTSRRPLSWLGRRGGAASNPVTPLCLRCMPPLAEGGEGLHGVRASICAGEKRRKGGFTEGERRD